MVHTKSQVPEFPKNVEQAQEIFGRLHLTERRELKEIIFILELLCGEISHFEQRDFLRRVDELSLNPVVMPKDMAEGLREMKEIFSREGMSWRDRFVFKSTAFLWRKKLNDAIAAEAGFTENVLWQRLITREKSTAAAFLICTLYDIRAGVVSKALEPRIRNEFKIRGWPLPSI